MNLISNKNSWDLIQNTFKNYYNNNNLKVNLFNIKTTLFTQLFVKEIIYIDNFQKEGEYFYPSLWKEPKRKLILVLNNTVTELPYSSLSHNSPNTPYWYLVFKHSAAELSNITCTSGATPMHSTSAITIFKTFNKVYVPEGLRNDYITFFSNMDNWDSTYEDQIVEGDEYDIE